MELLILKCGKDYIRVKDDCYCPCGMDKASVFPMDRLEEARRHLETAGRSGFADLCINKLVISEEPLESIPPSDGKE